jgi:hypothetical protein
METEHYMSAPWIQDENKVVEGKSLSLKICAETKGFSPEEEKGD